MPSFDPHLLLARFNEFKDKAAEARNPDLKKKYERARDLTALASDKIQALANAAEIHLDDEQVIRDAQDATLAISKDMLDEGRQYVRELKREKDPAKRRQLAEQAQTFALKLRGKDAIMTSYLIAFQQQHSLSELVEPLQVTLTVALKRDHKELLKEATFSSAEFGVHFVPVVGAFIAAGMALNRLSALEAKKAESVDAYLNYVDAYCHALMVWCEAADEVINRLKRRL